MAPVVLEVLGLHPVGAKGAEVLVTRHPATLCNAIESKKRSSRPTALIFH